MSIVDSLRGVLWARRRQPEQIAYAAALASERFGPGELIEQAVAAERAGFDAVITSDHINPWWLPGAPAPASCHNAWVWLGAATQATERVSLGTGPRFAVGRPATETSERRAPTWRARSSAPRPSATSRRRRPARSPSRR